MFDQFTVGKRIYCGFFLILFLLVVVGGISRFALNSASAGFMEYRRIARNSNLAGRVQANMVEARFDVKNYLLNNKEEFLKKFEERWAKVIEFTTEAKSSIVNPERSKKINEVAVAINDYKLGFDKVVQLQGQGAKLFDEMNTIGPVMEKALAEILASARDAGDFEITGLAGLAMRDLLLGRLYGTKYHDSFEIQHAERARQELAHMQEILDAMDKKLQNSESRKRFITVAETKSRYQKTLDEMVRTFSERNKIIAETLDRIGPIIGQDIEDVKLSIISDQDKLGPLLQASNEHAVVQVLVICVVSLILGIAAAFFIARSVTEPVKHIVDGLTGSADQIASASVEVSSASQQLAEGSSEQAASIEETTSSLEEMASMTKQNASHASQADSLMKEASQVVKQANDSMTELTQAMNEITQASEETSKIIKTIDEIAFQTNLLALNAAVEAARAGEAGAGFAVVADEVRNLAMRAADAAKNTAAMIEGTVKKVNEGSVLVTRTHQAFTQVTLGTSKVGELVGEIAIASREQAQGIDQVTQAATEMDKVIQQNAANAEENASASEELSAQSEEMRSYVAGLEALVGSSRNDINRKPAAVRSVPKTMRALPTASKKQLPIHSRKERSPNEIIPMDDSDFSEF